MQSKSLSYQITKHLYGADQAAEVADVPVAVVPSKTISQGMTAMLAFNDQQSLEENKASMTEMLDSVVSGQVTTAVRDTTIDDVEIKKMTS